MPFSLLPDECFSDVLSFLDGKSLYKCLFVNRYYCKFTIPLIWREPFIEQIPGCFSLINTLLACLNEDEISSLIPCAINFNINQSSLFEYGKFVRIIDHDYCVDHVKTWLELSHSRVRQDCRVRKLIDVIYHMIMRQGSNLQELFIEHWNYFYDLPKLSIFTNYEPGITNLRSLRIGIDNNDDENYKNYRNYENTTEFLSTMTRFCNGIVKCEFRIAFLNSFVDIIKLQPLESIFIDINGIRGENAQKVIRALEFRSETLKELSFTGFNFEGIDLSFISKLNCLERLYLTYFYKIGGYETQNLFTKKFHLKELKLELWNIDFNFIGEIMNSFCSQALHKLTLNIITPETGKLIRESCPNIKFLHITIRSEEYLSLTIPPICELSSLKILKIGGFEEFSGPLFEILGDNLKFVECLSLSFHINLSSFKYFTDNCKANLKKWIIFINTSQNSVKDYLIHVSGYQRVHNSLKLLKVMRRYKSINDEESEIIDLLKSQGVDVDVPSSWEY